MQNKFCSQRPEISLFSRLLDALVEVKIPKNYFDEKSRNIVCFQQVRQDELVNSYYKDNSFEERLEYELESIGLMKNSQNQLQKTPNDFVEFLNGLIGHKIDEYPNLVLLIKDKSIEHICPYICKDSNFKKDTNIHYLKFVCKLYTSKKCNCGSYFTIHIQSNIISSIKFSNLYHNHPMDELFIGSNVTLLTSLQKSGMKDAASKGMPSEIIRQNFARDLLPNQLYNTIRKEKQLCFKDEIPKLFDYVQTLQNEYDIIWKNDNSNKFYSLLVINARIRTCDFSNDIVMIDDTECTNHFQYPFLLFIVFDENNHVQNLAISIITSKEESSFINILESLKKFIPTIRVFIIDRLKAQLNAIEHVYPNSSVVFCKVHIARNIQSHMGRNSDVIHLFWQFVSEEIPEDVYVQKLTEKIRQTNSMHLKNLLNDLNYYSPSKLKYLRLRGHDTTNAIEGSFGNVKKWTNNKPQPLEKILNLFLTQGRLLMKKHIGLKYKQLDPSLYEGRKLGQFAVEEFHKRYQLCLAETAKLLNQDKNIANETLEHLSKEKCNCNKDDLPCIHEIHERLLKLKKGEQILKEEDIPIAYFYHDLKIANPPAFKISNVSTENKEKWDYNSTMDKLKPYVDLAQRSEPVRELLRNFFKEAETLKKSIDPMAKGIIVTPGAKPTVPSATVDKYSFRRKRTVHCSVCHKAGHYANTCPFKKKDDE